MTKIEKRVERLEEVACPALTPKEQRRNEELARRMVAGRARVMAASRYKPLAGKPDISDILPLPNGKVDIGAILQRVRAWHTQQLQKTVEA